jgi:hypothetical protein
MRRSLAGTYVFAVILTISGMGQRVFAQVKDPSSTLTPRKLPDAWP